MPESVEGFLTTSYLAPNSFIHKREIAKQVFPRYREDTLFDFLFYTERKVLSDNTRFNWFEWDYLYGYATVLSNVATNTAGAPTTITIDTASHQESGTKSSGKKWDSVMVNGIHGWVSAIDKSTANAHTYTIQPVDDTANFGVTDALAADILVFYSNAKSDGSGMPESMVRKPTLYYSYTQIFATQYMAFGSESTNKIEFNVDGKPYYYLQGVEDAALKHKMDIQFAFLLNTQGDTIVDSDNGDEPVYHTRGIESYIDNFGNTQTYTTLDFADLTDIEKTLSRERAPDQMMWINGVNLDIDIDNLVKGKMDNSGINYSAFGKGNASQRAVDFGFGSFRFSKRTYHKKAVDYMNYLPVTGYAGSPYPDMGFIIPLDRVRDAKSNKEMDTIAMRYKQNDRVNRFIKHWTRDVTITNLDRIEFNHLSEVGLQMAAVNQCIKVAK